MEVTSIYTPNNPRESQQTRLVRHHLESIIAAMPGHVYWKNTDGVFLGCNDQQAKTLGLNSRYDVVGKTTYDMVWWGQSSAERKQQADLINATDREIIRSGTAKTLEEPLVLPDGTVAVYLSTKAPLYDQYGKAIGILGISLDITAEKKLEELKLQKSQAITNAMRLLAAAMAHELRTPLASINMGINALQDQLPKLIAGYQKARDNNLAVETINDTQLEKFSVLLTLLKQQVHTATTFVDLSLSNLNYGGISKENFTALSIKNILEQVCSEYPLQLHERSIISLQLTHDFQFHGDVRLTKHVFYNLIKNALWYIHAANKGDITITTNTVQDEGVIIFKDTGTGIEANVLPHIFDKFYSKRTSGSGVGLSFCKMVVESYGGTIHCEFELGKHTTFTIKLPIQINSPITNN